MTNALLAALAGAIYTLFAGAAVLLFKATDPSAQSTKTATLWAGTATAVVIIWNIAGSDPIGVGLGLVSAAFLAAAGALFMWSVGEQRRQLQRDGSLANLQYAGSTAPPPQLTVTGPYQFVRHPIYTSYALGWIGGAIASMAPLAVLMTLIMLGLYVVSARTEEQAILRSDFADTYRGYQKSTTMFIPFVF
jgi:protein-S-isoprenylcysteine O-methyltransferase Ste14